MILVKSWMVRFAVQSYDADVVAWNLLTLEQKQEMAYAPYVTDKLNLRQRISQGSTIAHQLMQFPYEESDLTFILTPEQYYFVKRRLPPDE